MRIFQMTNSGMFNKTWFVAKDTERAIDLAIISGFGKKRECQNTIDITHLFKDTSNLTEGEITYFDQIVHQAGFIDHMKPGNLDFKSISPVKPPQPTPCQKDLYKVSINAPTWNRVEITIADPWSKDSILYDLKKTIPHGQRYYRH